MTQIIFGCGALWATHRVDVVKFGLLQNICVDFEYTPHQGAVCLGKITGKATFCRVAGLTFNALFCNERLSSRQLTGTAPTFKTTLSVGYGVAGPSLCLVTEELLGVSGGILLDRATPEDAGDDLTLITRDIARGL